MKQKIFNALKLVLGNYAILITLIVTIELIGQLAYRVARGKFLFSEPPNNPFEEHPYLSAKFKNDFVLMSPDQKMTITTNHQGYRITRKDQTNTGKINVVCLGGSTTFGTNVTDEDSWPYLLQEKLGDGYNVYNLGVPGYSTVESIVQLTTIVPELKPDIIIIYQGWNDIRSYHTKPKSPDYYWHGMSQKTNLQVRPRPFGENFVIFQLTLKMRRALQEDGSDVLEISDKNDPYIDSLYVRNLKTIKLLCDGLHAKTIFIPQLFNREAYKDYDSTSTGWTPCIPNRKFPELMERFNALMGKAVMKDSHTVVIDSILSQNDWRPEHFADNGHFSRAGGILFTEIILKRF